MPKPNVKEQIVTASLDLLHSKGFNATSVQDITEAAGVPKGSFYNHFTSKEALGVEVLQRYAEQAGRCGGLLEQSTLAPLDRLRHYFGQMVDAHAASDFCAGCMLGNFSTELSNQSPAIRGATQQSFVSQALMVEQIIAQGQRDGSVAAVHPASELANFVVDAWQGAVLRAKAEKDRAPLDRFVNMLLSRILV